MKTQLLLVTACLISFLVHAQTTDLATRQLRGKVKSIIEISYEVVQKFGEPEKGAIIKKDYREYNSAGYETQYGLEDFTSAGVKTKKSFRYGNNNKVVDIREETDGKVKLTKIEYNAQGKMNTVDFTDGNGQLENRQKYKYDADGLLVQTDTYNSDGSLKFKIVRTYNAGKQLVKKEWYNPKGNATWQETFAYDANGNLAEETSIDRELPNPTPTTRKYRYNEKKQKVEESYSRSGAGNDKLFSDDFNETMEYNEQGDMVTKSFLFQEEKIVYTYDKHNNWIRPLRLPAMLSGSQSRRS